MKRTVVFLIVLCLCSFKVIEAQDMKYGLKGSLLATTFNVEDNGLLTLKPGYAIGGFFHFYFMDAIGVSVEPAYALKGTHDFDVNTVYYSESPLINGGDFKSHSLSLSVIEVPVLAQLKFNLGGNTLRIFGGPSFDFILKANHNMVRLDYTLGEDFAREIESNNDVTDRFEYIDYGGKLGMGMDFDISPLILMIALDYRYGFNDINNTRSKPAIHTHGFGLTVGIGMGQ